MEKNTHTLDEKLLKVQHDLKAPKMRDNKFGGFAYRTCEDILQALKPSLLASGLLLTLTDEIIVVGERYYLKATATVSCSTGETKSCYGWAREPLSKKGMDESQVTGAASSYARKYALNALFLIDDNRDADSIGLVSISKEQAENLNAALKETGSDISKFCALFGSTSVENIAADDYKSARKAIKAKVKKGA